MDEACEPAAQAQIANVANFLLSQAKTISKHSKPLKAIHDLRKQSEFVLYNFPWRERNVKSGEVISHVLASIARLPKIPAIL